ncbi:hypothetical protein DGWBC_0428 [Dehalogenimonas sp. WBC-2]|nr:hypothetical protein DGWBC_0428 [Dehalogenimonas sp. WBC-2]
MAKTKVFVSYDFDYDAPLKETVIGQSKLPDSPFSINDVSLKETVVDWQQKAREYIESCDVFLVLLGENTHKCSGVLREAKMARQLNKTRFQLRKQGHMPIPVDGAGEVIVWKWKNLKHLLKREGKFD